MLETLLEHREKVTFDLAVHAAGLAETVRAHGGACCHSEQREALTST
jgi:hypothetical protein